MAGAAAVIKAPKWEIMVVERKSQKNSFFYAREATLGDYLYNKQPPTKGKFNDSWLKGAKFFVLSTVQNSDAFPLKVVGKEDDWTVTLLNDGSPLAKDGCNSANNTWAIVTVETEDGNCTFYLDNISSSFDKGVFEGINVKKIKILAANTKVCYEF